MHERRKLPGREHVFILSLKYHGFRVTWRHRGLKRKKGYVIPSTWRDDAAGIDFWVKMPRSDDVVPVQITQRGVVMYKKRFAHRGTDGLAEFEERSRRRIKSKQDMCRENRIAFVLVRDFIGERTSTTLAWGDVKALRRAMERLG